MSEFLGSMRAPDATSATVMVGRYGLYLSISFGETGTAFMTLDDRGSWTMDTDGLVSGSTLRQQLEQFQNQVRTELQHVLEQQAKVRADAR